MMRRRSARTSLFAGALVATALAIVLAGCGGSASDDDATAVGNAATVDQTTTTTAPATSTAPTTAPVATTGLATQEETVRRLYDAWFADDKKTAATVADQTAIDGMWKTARGDYSLYNSCSTGEFDTSGCLYRGNNGTIQFTLERRGDFWIVIEAFYAEP